MRHSSIYIKGMLLIAIPLFSQILFLGTLVKIRADQQDAQAWALHATHVVVEADTLAAQLAETQNALRGYLLTHDPDLAQQYRTFQARTQENLQRLAELVAGQPEQLRRVERIAVQVAALASWFERLSAMIEGQRYAEALRAARGRQGQALMDEARRSMHEFLQAEQALSADRQAHLQEQANVQDLALFAGGALAVISTALLGYVFARGIAVRLQTLADNARRIAAGKELLAPLDGADELARLDRVFREMAQALEQKNQENEMFVYSVSHDLRSPLVNLQGFSQELAASCADLRRLVLEADLPAARRQRALDLLERNMADSVRFIQTAVTRLSGIIDALLRLSRAGRVEYRWQLVDVQTAVRRSVDALRSTLDQRRAEIVLDELPPVWGDPTAVEQVFANLIGNAANYLDPKRPGRIEIGCLSADETAGPQASRTYYVRDNGLGIPAALQPKVFIAFQRLHPELAAGEGIGLALVRRVVERHGGRIWLESSPGVGTTFYVSLPAHAPVGVEAAGVAGSVMVAS